MGSYINNVEAKPKRSPGRPKLDKPGPASLEAIKRLHMDLKTNYPHGIFKQLASEYYAGRRKSKYPLQISAMFAEPNRYSVTTWQRMFKLAAVVKAHYK